MMKRIHLLSFFITITLGLYLTFLVKQPFFRITSQNLETLKSIHYSESISREEALKTSLKFVSGELFVFPIITPQNRELFVFSGDYKLPLNKPRIEFMPHVFSLLNIQIYHFQRYRISAYSHWSLGLNTSVKHKINIISKTGKHFFDFSGLPLEEFILRVKTGFLQVTFTTQNPTIIENFLIQTGAVQCHIRGLLYANAKNILIKSNAGNFLLDFSGQQKINSQVHIIGRLGNTKLILPENINAKIEIHRGILSLNSVKGFRKIASNTYITPNFSDTKPHCVIFIQLSSGKISVN